jgi:MFS family permease
MKRRQVVIARVLVVVWLSLIALAFAGSNLPFVPSVISKTLTLIAIGSMLFIVPAALLLRLTREDAASSGTASWIAVGFGPLMIVFGPILLVGGVLLVLPLSDAPIGVRIAGIVAVVLGVLQVWIAVLAFRTKREERTNTKPL